MNEIAYFEVAGPDAAKLAEFYAQVFGWRPSPGPFPSYHSLADGAGPGIRGGIRQEAQPERVIYMKVASLEDTIAQVVQAGGKVLIPPTNVPGVVHFALFEDPAGNRTGIIQ